VDPTGHDSGWLGGLVSAVTSTVSSAVSTVAPVVQAVAPAAVAVLDATTGIPSMINDVHTIFSGNSSTLDKIVAGGDLLLNVAMDVGMVVGVGEGQMTRRAGCEWRQRHEWLYWHSGRLAMQHDIPCMSRRLNELERLR
jgi:phage-related protein